MPSTKIDHMNIAENTCSGCNHPIVKSGIKCKICPKVFHRHCAKKIKKCCGEEITGSLLSSRPHEGDLPDSDYCDSNIDITESSSNNIINLQRKIIYELQDKCRLFEENTALLKFKISVLEDQISKNNSYVYVRGSKKNVRTDNNIPVDENNQGKSSGNVTADTHAVTHDPVKLAITVDPSERPTNTNGPQRKQQQSLSTPADNYNIPVKNASTGKDNSIKGATNDMKIIEWTSVISRKQKRKNRSPLVVGNCAEVQGVERMRAFHVSRLRPDTTAESLRDFLKGRFSSVECERLQSRYPDSYASFKVLIPSSEYDKVQIADNWPNYASIHHFFQKRKRINGDIKGPLTRLE